MVSLSKYKVRTNFVISVFVQQFNFGARRKIRFVKIFRSLFTARILWLLYNTGIIRTFVMKKDCILIYYKYYLHHKVLAELSLISRPGKRAYWTIQNMAMNYGMHNFNGFYIVSTPRGLSTSDVTLLRGELSGEVLMKVDVL